MTKEWEKVWLSQDEFKEIPDVNVYPHISVFNRKLYTFGTKEEAYIKFTRINTAIRSYDELAYLDTNSCVYKVDESTYIVILNFPEKNKITVLGELSKRHIEKNKLDSLDVQIRDGPQDGREVGKLNELWDSETLEVDSLVECVNARITKNFSSYIGDIRTGSA